MSQGTSLTFMTLYNKDVARVVLEKAPQNAKYTSPDIQKELLQMFAMKVQEAIRDEIGTAEICKPKWLYQREVFGLRSC